MKKFLGILWKVEEFESWESFKKNWVTMAQNPTWYITIGFALFAFTLSILTPIPHWLSIVVVPLMILLWKDSSLIDILIGFSVASFIYGIFTHPHLFNLPMWIVVGTILTLMTLSCNGEFKYKFPDKLEHFGLHFIITGFALYVTHSVFWSVMISLSLNILYEFKDGISPTIYRKLPDAWKNNEFVKHGLNTDGFSFLDVIAGIIGMVVAIVI